MPDISKVQLPSGGIYDIKDATARELISGGINFDIVWTQSDYTSASAPTSARLASIPAGVVVQYNSGASTATGTLAASASTKATFKLVYSPTQTTGSPLDKYDEYVTVQTGTTAYIWEKIGDTQVDLGSVVQSVTVNGTLVNPDASAGGTANITTALNDWVTTKLANEYNGSKFGLDIDTSVTPNTVALKVYNESTGFGGGVPFLILVDAFVALANQPLHILQPLSTGVYRFYDVIGVDFTTFTVKLLCVEGGTRYEATLSAIDNVSPLTGTFTATAISSTVTLDKHQATVLGSTTSFTNSTSAVTFSGGTSDTALGEATTFALTSGSVTHGDLTGHTTNVLGTETTFTGSVTPQLNNTTKYLSASASGGSVAPSGDDVTVVTGYASPTTDKALGEATTFALTSGSVAFETPSTDTFVKSVSTTSNKNLVTTTVPNVTGNTDVSIPNVTGNTDVSIPNVTSVGSASTWTFAMGTGEGNTETLIISGGNSTAPTLGTALSASKVTLGTALSASKVTLGNAITVATGSADANGTGAALVTGVSTPSTGSAITSLPSASVSTGITVGTNDKVTALTGLGTPSTDTVVGTSSTFTVTDPTVTLTVNDSSAAGRVQYLQTTAGANSTVSVSVNSADTVAAVTSMPTSTVGTGITVGSNDPVTAITSVGTGTAAAQTITVGTTDRPTVLTSDTDITSA